MRLIRAFSEQHLQQGTLQQIFNLLIHTVHRYATSSARDVAKKKKTAHAGGCSFATM
jgi:hypothetical protein